MATQELLFDHEDDEARYEEAHVHQFEIEGSRCWCTDHSCFVWLARVEVESILNGADRRAVIGVAERRQRRGKR